MVDMLLKYSYQTKDDKQVAKLGYFCPETLQLGIKSVSGGMFGCKIYSNFTTVLSQNLLIKILQL